jgi:signal peptidase I
MKILRTVVAVSTLLIAGCSSQTFLAESPSMEPTIARGSKVKVDLSAYRSATPARFDIVVFRPPTNKDHVFMFRVLALPGEHLSLGESQVVIDGKVVSAPVRISYSSLASGHPATYNNITLAKDEYFLVGDNVAGANDSRFLGPIHMQAIMGKVVKIMQAH